VTFNVEESNMTINQVNAIQESFHMVQFNYYNF